MSQSHKKKTAIPQLLVGSRGVASVTSQTKDRRHWKSRRTVADSGIAGSSASAEYWEEDLATNAAMADPDFSWGLGDDLLEAQPDEELGEGIHVVVGQPRNKNSVSTFFIYNTGCVLSTRKDCPLQSFVLLTDEYVEESLHREGRGSKKIYAKCAGVSCIDPARRCPNTQCDGVAEYRCSDGVCFGEVMRCATCIVAAHAQHPTHFIEVWILRAIMDED
jgi:hypothetical protein